MQLKVTFTKESSSVNGTEWYAMVTDVENNIVVAEAKKMSTAKEAYDIIFERVQLIKEKLKAKLVPRRTCP
jgi:Golgi nucleoside diphosphatase